MLHSDHLAQFLEHLKYERRASAHTLRNYEGDLRHFLRYLATQEEPMITRDAIRAWLSALHQSYSRNSVTRKLAAVKTFCQYLTRNNLIDSDPAALIASPRRERRLPKYLSRSNVTMLLEAPDISTDQGKRDRAILELLYATGIRVSELVNLNLSDLDLATRLLNVKKNHITDRTIPFGEPAREALESYVDIRGHFLPAHADHKTLFISYLGVPLTSRAIHRIVATYTKNIGSANPRSLRHSFAWHLVDRGMDHRTLQTLLGHKQIISTTSTYGSSLEALRGVYDLATS